MLYIQAINSGKGFITATDRHRFAISGYPANIWAVEINSSGRTWAEEKIRFNEGQSLPRSVAQEKINIECVDSVDEDGNSIEPPILP